MTEDVCGKRTNPRLWAPPDLTNLATGGTAVLALVVGIRLKDAARCTVEQYRCRRHDDPEVREHSRWEHRELADRVGGVLVAVVFRAP